MNMLYISLFGQVQLRREGNIVAAVPAKVQELLFYLLLHRTQPHSRESLACELWAEAPVMQAKKYLRQCLWQLQQAFDQPTDSRAPMLRLDHEWVSIHADAALWVDVHRFDEACVLVRDVPGHAFDERQIQTAQAAAELYQGDLLSGWYQDWCLIERERFQSMHFALLDKLMDFCAAHRQFDQGIAYGMCILRSEYTRETTHRRLMRLYASAGDRSAALRQFEHCAAALKKEFAIQPTERTIALFEQIRDDQFSDNIAPEHVYAADRGTGPQMLAQLLAELTNVRASLSSLQYDMDQIKQALHHPT